MGSSTQTVPDQRQTTTVRKQRPEATGATSSFTHDHGTNGGNGQDGIDLIAALQAPEDLPPALVPVETITSPLEGKYPEHLTILLLTQYFIMLQEDACICIYTLLQKKRSFSEPIFPSDTG